jgi:hypothetical protein
MPENNSRESELPAGNARVPMNKNRVALIAGLLVLVALIVMIAVASRGARTPIIAVAALVFLIGGGNLLYGKNSHGAMAQARTTHTNPTPAPAADPASDLPSNPQGDQPPSP